VAQLVEWQIRDLKDVGSNLPGVFGAGAAAAEFPDSIWLKFMAVMQNTAPGRARRGPARHGT
jgi:hypothetical protein